MAAFFPKVLVCAAALNCVVFWLSIVPHSASAEKGEPAAHRQSGVSTRDNEASDPGQVGGAERPSVFVEKDVYAEHEEADKNWSRHGSRRRRGGRPPTGMSLHPARWAGKSPARKPTAASGILVISTLAAVALFIFWQLGIVFVKCLARSRALKGASAPGSSPRSLADPANWGREFNTLCQGMDLVFDDDVFGEGPGDIPLRELSGDAAGVGGGGAASELLLGGRQRGSSERPLPSSAQDVESGDPGSPARPKPGPAVLFLVIVSLLLAVGMIFLVTRIPGQGFTSPAPTRNETSLSLPPHSGLAQNSS